MSGDVINLRQFRKDKARAEKDKRAVENRTKFGMSKAEKQKIKSDKDRIIRQVDGARLTSQDDDTR